MSSSPSEDERLARVLECPRDAYSEGDADLRAAFAEPTDLPSVLHVSNMYDVGPSSVPSVLPSVLEGLL